MYLVAATTNSADMYGAAAIGAFLGAFLIWIVCVVLAYEILMIVSYWKLFNKAGEKGWKCLIPLYNDYVRYKITWKPSVFWFILISGIITSGIAHHVSKGSTSGFWTVLLVILMIVLCLVYVVLSIIGEVKLAKAYGKGTGFAVVLILTGFVALDWIPMLVLAFGKSKYVGDWKPAKK